MKFGIISSLFTAIAFAVSACVSPVTLTTVADSSEVADAADTRNEELQWSFTSLLNSSFDADGPGAVVIVTKNNETIFHGVRGIADLSSGRDISADTVFRYASITKQMSATTLMLLAEEGLVDLDGDCQIFCV